MTDAEVAARAIDLMRADAFPFTEQVDQLAEIVHRGLGLSNTDEMVQRAAQALADDENKHRYEGGPSTSPMVEPPEFDAEDFEDIARRVLTVALTEEQKP